MMKKVASFLKEKRRWVWLSGFLGILLIAGSIYAVWYNSHPIGRKWRINTERINIHTATTYIEDDGKTESCLNSARVKTFGNVNFSKYITAFNQLGLRAIKEVEWFDRYVPEGAGEESYGGGTFVMKWQDNIAYYVEFPSYDDGDLKDKTLCVVAYPIVGGTYGFCYDAALCFEVTKPEALREIGEIFDDDELTIDRWRREEQALREHQEKIRMETYAD